MQCIDSNYECPLCMDKQINLRLIDTYEKCSICSTIFSPTIICNECFKHCSNACPYCRSENQVLNYYNPINSFDKILYFLKSLKISLSWNVSSIHKKTYCQKYDLINEFKNVIFRLTRTNLYPSKVKIYDKKKNLIKEFIETFKKLWTSKKKISKDNKITGAHIIMNFKERSEKNNISIFDKFTFNFKFKNHKFIINEKVKDNIKKESEYNKVMMKSLINDIENNDTKYYDYDTKYYDYDNKKMRKCKKKSRLKKSTQNKIKKEYVKKKKGKYHNFYRGQKITN